VLPHASVCLEEAAAQSAQAALPLVSGHTAGSLVRPLITLTSCMFPFISQDEEELIERLKTRSAERIYGENHAGPRFVQVLFFSSGIHLNPSFVPV